MSKMSKREMKRCWEKKKRKGREGKKKGNLDKNTVFLKTLCFFVVFFLLQKKKKKSGY